MRWSASRTPRSTETYLADANGKRLAWVEQNALDAAHPYAPSLGGHWVPNLRQPHRAGRVEALLPDAHPKVGPRQALSRLFLTSTAARTASRLRTNGTSRCRSTRHSSTAAGSLPGRQSRRPIAAARSSKMQIYHRDGRAEVADQLRRYPMAARAALRRSAKIAVMGWSYGGYMTLKMLEKAPGVFAAAHRSRR